MDIAPMLRPMDFTVRIGRVLVDDRLTITTTIADGMPTMDYADIKSPVLQARKSQKFVL